MEKDPSPAALRREILARAVTSRAASQSPIAAPAPKTPSRVATRPGARASAPSPLPTSAGSAGPRGASPASEKNLDAAAGAPEAAKPRAGAARRKVRQRHRPETRAQMLERLTNPLISLHEASVLLRVCSATVRRLANENDLPHERTEGGQRRFRLRDVLRVLEEREAKRSPGRVPRRVASSTSSTSSTPLASRTSSVRPASPVGAPATPGRNAPRAPAIDPRARLAEAQARVQAARQQAARAGVPSTTPSPTPDAPPAGSTGRSPVRLGLARARGAKELGGESNEAEVKEE